MALPKILYAKEEDGNGEHYIAADANLDSLVDDEPVMIGTYELVDKSKWKKKVTPA